jgi:hypothetical protein
MAPLAAMNAQDTMPYRPQMCGERGVASCDVGQLFKPPKGFLDQALAMKTKPGTDMVCDMIRPEGMSRPVGTAMQTKPGTNMICSMICKPKGMSSPVGTAMQAKPGMDMIR